MGVQIGRPDGQTSWELLCLLLALMVWAKDSHDETLTILGDNVGSLQAAISLKSAPSLRCLCRELALLQTLHHWRFNVGHIPTELNGVADALSRLKEEQDAAAIAVLTGATRVRVPSASEFWRAS